MTEQPKLLIMGVPECGIGLLNEVVQTIPELQNGFWLNQWEENIVSRLETLNPGKISTGYLNYSKTLKQYLDDNKIGRLFIYKDPRDMILTYLSYILEESNHHHHHKYFTELDMNERIMKFITGFNESEEIAKQYGLEAIGYGNIVHHYLPYLRWIHDPNTCVVRYEKLVNKTTQSNELARIAEYLWNNITEPEITKADYIKHMDNIQSQVTFPFSSSEWKKYFTEENKTTFKKEAGELLGYLGYEKDSDW